MAAGDVSRAGPSGAETNRQKSLRPILRLGCRSAEFKISRTNGTNTSPPILAVADRAEAPLKGGLLVANTGGLLRLYRLGIFSGLPAGVARRLSVFGEPGFNSENETSLRC